MGCLELNRVPLHCMQGYASCAISPAPGLTSISIIEVTPGGAQGIVCDARD